MIPPLIHQIWHPFCAPEMPLDWQRFARSWRRWHPDHRYTLWGPDESRAFVAAHHPDFLPTYDSYDVPIKRVDALRVLLLATLGGIYADLDLECLRRVDELLDAHELLLVAEPRRHSTHWRDRGHRQVLSTAFLASVPGHPFWSDVKDELERSAAIANPMDATGPFLVTRCWERSRHLSVTMVAPETFYPIDEPACLDGTAYDVEAWTRASKEAYGIHHWANTWLRPGLASRPARRPYPAGLPLRMRHPQLHRDRPGQLVQDGPLVSCLMVTRGRREPARWAIECFRNQSYANRELVLVTTTAEGDLREHVAELQDPRIRFGGVFPAGTPLGTLRNLAMDNAKGELIATWDDDDLSGADRLAAQVTALVTTGADASFLDRVTVWSPARREITVSSRSRWENTLVARRRAVPRYQDVDRGEQRDATERLEAQRSLVLLEDANLYVHSVTGADSRIDEESPALPGHSSFRARGEDYERALTVLGKHVPVLAYQAWLEDRDPRSFAPPPPRSGTPHAVRTPEQTTRTRLVPPPVSPLQRTDPPLRFLFAWELGGGLGHTVPLSLIARPLLTAGHEVHLVLSDLSSARAGLGSLAAHPGLRLWQAPAWVAPAAAAPVPVGYADLLLRAGYADPVRLAGLVDGWESLFRSIDPDLLLVDHAPTALLAAKGRRFARATSGTGFFHPLAESPIPTFRDWESVPAARLLESEGAALSTCNAILAARGLPHLRALHELVAADEHFLLTVPELDHFPRRGLDPAQRYYGVLPAASHGRPATWPGGSAPTVFAYVKSEYRSAQQVLEALGASPWRILAYVPGCSPRDQAKYATPRLQISAEPIDMTEVCRTASAVLCHAGSGTAMTALHAGKPLVVLPMHVEQFLVARRVQAIGAGLVVMEDRLETLASCLQRVVEQPSFREAAEAFARRHACPDGNRVADAVAARCQELALEARRKRS